MGTSVSLTAREILTRARRKINALEGSETISAEEMADGLTELQIMLDEWSGNGLLIPLTVQATYNLVIGTASYTLGPSGSFVGVRPVEILSAVVRDGDTDYPIRSMGKDEYYGIAVKGISSLPRAYFLEMTGANATIRLDVKPDKAYQLVLFTRDPIAWPDTANTSLSFPPGVMGGIIANLAVRLAPEFGKMPAATLLNEANASRKDLESRYSQRYAQRYPAGMPGMRGGWDIRSNR